MNKLNSPAVFDIGAHRGDDTHIYLRKGFSVLAVEANPDLISFMKVRFASEIDNGRLFIINAAVHSSKEEHIDFFIAGDDSKSSIRSMGENRKIIVQTTQLKSLIEQFGIPLYCKIDIENADGFALDSLDRSTVPENISVEISGESIEFLASNENSIHYTIDKLAALGYKRFKLVDQEDLTVLGQKSHYPQKAKLFYRVKSRLLRFLSLNKRTRILDRFELDINSEISGPTPEELEGEWESYDQIKKLALFHFREYAAMTKDKKLIFWVDVYARC